MADVAKRQSSLGAAGIGTRNPNLNLVDVKSSTADAEEEAWSINVRGDTALDSEARPDWWWTGKKPVYEECPGVDVDGYIHSLPLPDMASCSRQSVLEYFDNVWTSTEILFSCLVGEEPFYRPPYHQLRHPMVFYYVHTAAVYVNKLRVSGVFDSAVNQFYEVLFETGVDEMTWDDLSKNEMEWPSIRDCNAYRKKVYNMVKEVIETHPSFDTILTDLQQSPLWALFLAFEHEKIHLETSSVLIRELPAHLVRHPKNFPPYHPSVPSEYTHPPVEGKDYPENEFISVDGGKAVLGKSTGFPSFGFDNEYGRKEIDVKPFKAYKYFVTNGEFWQFVKAGGYREKRYWTESGWGWRVFRNAKWPTFWVPFGPQGLHQYKLRNLFSVVNMPYNWPAEVNCHEAVAYCNWLNELKRNETGKDLRLRITTEAEHQLLRDEQNLLEKELPVERLGELDPAMSLSGQECINVRGYNYQLAYSSACPVDAHQPNSKGLHDVFGNVWHWCLDYFCPFPGFDVHPVYDDFSTPCFDGKHNVILGGSFMSCGQLASAFARYHFRPHFFQHAGFRVVVPSEDEVEPRTTSMDAPAPYFGSDAVQEVESADDRRRRELEASLKESFGSANDKLPEDKCGPLWSIRDNVVDFAGQVASIADKFASRSGTQRRALDVGCGVGGVTLRLASGLFSEVIGIDAEVDVIDVAKEVLEKGVYNSEAGSMYTIEKPSGSVSFRLADACCLPLDMGKFDAVILSRLLDRVPSPKAALGRFGGPMGMVAPGGVVIVISADDFREEFAPCGAWLDLTSAAPEQEHLGAAFKLIHTQQVASVLDGSNSCSFTVDTYKVRVYRRV